MLLPPQRVSAFAPVSAGSATCKCCSALAPPFGTVDFHKSCEDHRRAPLAPAGIPISYHRCTSSGFVFSVALDAFTTADFHEHIYNEEYLAVDPDFADSRPRHNARWIGNELFPGLTSLRTLDYGGGNGLMAQLLRGHGVVNAQSYDPFYAGERPTRRFDLVTCFEVLEHTTTPFETLRDIRSFVNDQGLLLFTTLLQPPEFNDLGLGWWYAAPRNGHVSLYSRAALTVLMKRLGLKWGSVSDNTHIAYRGRVPAFARHLVGGSR